jgi:hypothetical protein
MNRAPTPYGLDVGQGMDALVAIGYGDDPGGVKTMTPIRPTMLLLNGVGRVGAVGEPDEGLAVGLLLAVGDFGVPVLGREGAHGVGEVAGDVVL